jgi:hypothetical protein
MRGSVADGSASGSAVEVESWAVGAAVIEVGEAGAGVLVGEGDLLDKLQARVIKITLTAGKIRLRVKGFISSPHLETKYR